VHLLVGLDRARPRDHLHRLAADRDPARVDHRVRLVPLARNELVRLHDVHRFLDARHRVEHLRIELALVADRADQRALGPARDMHVETVRADLRLDSRNRAVARVLLHGQ
jgi:hypothetical protein